MGSRFLFGVLPYLSIGLFAAGVAFRFLVWLRTPVPMRIVVPPGPGTRLGVALRLIGDLLWFPNLFRGEKALWAGGWCFHVLLWLVLLRHLRYFLYPIPGWIAEIQTIGLYSGYFISIPLAYLLARRLLLERTLYLSILGDYFALFLLLSVTLSGLVLQLYFRTDLINVKALINGLIHFQFLAPDAHWLFGLHFGLVMVLLVYFPFGKLMHGGGLVLSPTRNQRTNFKKRFVNPWDVSVQYSDKNLSTPETYRQSLAHPKEGDGG